jgi:hypothetical protein
MAIEMPSVARHPNRAAFRGVLTFIDTPSDKAPAGARGHRVLLTREGAEQALPSLLGMALDYAPALDRHDARRKVGIITRAEVLTAGQGMLGAKAQPAGASDRKSAGLAPHLRAAAACSWMASTTGTSQTAGSRIEVAGYVFARDFPELVRELRRGGPRQFGMSYEITDARIDDLRASIWTITEFLFTGAAVLRRDKAAYQNTWIELE